MIRVRGLISSIKSSLLTNRNAFPHKIEQSWDREFNEQNPKLNYLQKLLQTNQIRPYFIQKDIKQLQKEDIYFYMYNKELFHKIPKHTKQQLIKNPNANTILKFHLALQLDTLRSQQVQNHLLQSFNSSIASLNTSDVLFCLELICGFKNVKEDINYYELEKKFLVEEDATSFIRFIFLLSQLEFKLEMIPVDIIQDKISMLDNLELEVIYQVKTIANFYEIQLTIFCQNRLRSSFMEKRKHFKEEESEFIVQLLQHYPQSANFINLQCLSIDSYIAYLEFFLPQDQEPHNQAIPKAIHHPIPYSILNKAQIYELSNIIKHRVTLQLQTPQSLTNSIKDYYTKNLNCIIAIIRYLQKEEKITPEFEAIMEKSIINKIIKKEDKIFQEYKIVDVFKILGYLSVNELGTMNFWKKTLKFVTNAIQDPQNYKKLSSDEQKKFVVYLFQIFKNKPFPRELQDQIINLTLLSLTINKWSLKEILPLIVSLKVNKIADNELWFGMEQRIKKIDIRHLDSHEDRRILRKVVYNFNLMGKGSYEFWSQINKNLNKKQKTQILNSFKVPSTMAHTYLKV